MQHFFKDVTIFLFHISCRFVYLRQLCEFGYLALHDREKFQTSEYIYASPRLFIWMKIMMKSKD